MPELSQSTQKLIQQYQLWHQSLQPEQGTTIHVDEVASRVAAFYEKIRGIIDWKEEHLLKRGAIERMLKRKLFSKINLIEGDFSGLSAESLVLELIRGGHFPNDEIEELKIEEVQKTIDKYIFVLNNAPASQDGSGKIQLCNWLSSIAACEIEETLSSSLRERALIDYMFEIIKERISFSKNITEETKEAQIYTAVQRSLFNLDSSTISYHLLKYKYPDWKNLNQEQLNEITENVYSIWKDLENNLNHPLGDKFYQICKKNSALFLLLGDIIPNHLTNINEDIANPESLEKLIRKAYGKRLGTLKSRLVRAAFYSTLSIFLTNIFSLLALEIPFTKIVTGEFNFFAVGVDIFVPTLLMFFLVISISPPKKENLEKIVIETIKIVYENKAKETYEIKSYRKKGAIFDFAINFLYSLFFCSLMASIIWGLYKINFPILSYVIFIIFLSLIAFAGAKIRQRAKELHVIEEKETFFHFLFDPFSIPVIQLGKWLTTRWKKYNVIAAFFSALIDMPFFVFVEFIEQWRYFLKEKKEKIY